MSRAARPARVLVEPSDYVVRNLGDTAMLTIALERISAMWPEARIQVFAEYPDEMPSIASNVEPLPIIGRQLWFGASWFPRMLRDWSLAHRAQSWMRRRFPRVTYHALRRWGGLNRQQIGELTDFFEAVTQADLVVVTGMGGVTSAFSRYAFELLEVVRCAQRFGAKSAMMGQGLGPIDGSTLERRARDVFGRLHLLTLREGRSSPRLVKRLGVSVDRVMVTGDDAIELACRLANNSAGNGIGINLRHSDYAGVSSADVRRVRDALAALSDRIAEAPFIGVPISWVPGEEDAHTIEELGADCLMFNDVRALSTTADIVVQIQRCRVVVAGSYHAGVFALSCGIPIVALVRSEYYIDKFSGLAEMFGAGCTIVHLDDPSFEERFAAAVTDLWSAADQLRPVLRSAADNQVSRSRTAYGKLKELLA